MSVFNFLCTMQAPKLSPQNCELLSALADGELQPPECQALLHACIHDPAASANWNAYHMIGEALRSPGSAVQLTDLAFLVRLNQQLAQEPHVRSGLQATMSTSCSGVVPASASTMLAGRQGQHPEPAANDGQFRWKMIAGFACAAAVCAVAWNASVSVLPAAGPQLARLGPPAGGMAPQQVVVASSQGLMVRDARLEELLAAHKHLGATSALPVPSGFLRNATFETPQSFGR